MYIHKYRLECYYGPDSVTGQNKTYTGCSKISEDMVSNEDEQYFSTLVQHRSLFIFVSTQTVHTAWDIAFCT
jgi:hypothetical protein